MAPMLLNASKSSGLASTTTARTRGDKNEGPFLAAEIRPAKNNRLSSLPSDLEKIVFIFKVSFESSSSGSLETGYEVTRLKPKDVFPGVVSKNTHAGARESARRPQTSKVLNTASFGAGSNRPSSKIFSFDKRFVECSIQLRSNGSGLQKRKRKATNIQELMGKKKKKARTKLNFAASILKKSKFRYQYETVMSPDLGPGDRT